MVRGQGGNKKIESIKPLQLRLARIKVYYNKTIVNLFSNLIQIMYVILRLEISNVKHDSAVFTLNFHGSKCLKTSIIRK